MESVRARTSRWSRCSEGLEGAHFAAFRQRS